MKFQKFLIFHFSVCVTDSPRCCPVTFNSVTSEVLARAMRHTKTFHNLHLHGLHPAEGLRLTVKTLNFLWKKYLQKKIIADDIRTKVDG